MLNTININLKTDIKTDRPTTLPIKLMSQDKNNNQFILRFTNGGESVTLDDSYTVEVLTKFRKSGTSRLTTAKVRQDYATWEFDTDYITQDETVYNYVYVRKSGNLVVSADANCFVFSVDLSEIDKGAGRVAEVYDENYQKHLDEFKDNVDFEEIAQAEQARKEAEILREESYEQKVDTAIVEADVVEKVDNKVTELTPQINNLTAQLAHTTEGFQKATNGKSNKTRPLVVFVSDDGPETEYTFLAPIFEAKNVTYTIATRGDAIDTAGGIKTNQLRELVAKGHSVCSHTQTHRDVATLTEEELRYEYRTSIERIEDATLSECRHVVYPFGSWNELAIDVAREYFVSGLATNREDYYVSENVLDQYAIPRQSIIYGDRTQVPWSAITSRIDECLEKDGLLIYCIHAFEFTENPENVDYLNQTIDYIQSKGIDIVNLDTAIEERSNVIDLGNFKGEYVKISKNGGIKSNSIDLNASSKSKLTIDINTPLDKFEIGKVTVSETFIGSGFPYNANGNLLTFNLSTNKSKAIQIYYPTGYDAFYKRSHGTSAWGDFVKYDSEVTAPVIRDSAVTNADAPPSAFSIIKVTMGQATGFPEGNGTVITSRLHTSNTAMFQLFYPANSRNFYKRTSVDTSTWGELQKYSPVRRIRKSISFGTVGAGAVIESSQAIPEATTSTAVTANPVGGEAGIDLFWNAYIETNGTVKIRVRNMGTTGQTLPTSWDIVLLG